MLATRIKYSVIHICNDIVDHWSKFNFAFPLVKKKANQGKNLTE